MIRRDINTAITCSAQQLQLSRSGEACSDGELFRYCICRERKRARWTTTSGQTGQARTWWTVNTVMKDWVLQGRVWKWKVVEIRREVRAWRYHNIYLQSAMFLDLPVSRDLSKLHPEGAWLVYNCPVNCHTEKLLPVSFHLSVHFQCSILGTFLILLYPRMSSKYSAPRLQTKLVHGFSCNMG